MTLADIHAVTIRGEGPATYVLAPGLPLPQSARTDTTEAARES